MGTKPRSEIFRPGEQAIVHTMNRCTRKCFLMSDTKKGRQRAGQRKAAQRRRMFEEELEKAASGFAIDLLSYAIMDNHFHLILRSRPDVLAEWDDEKVVMQWHKLCPVFKDKEGFPVDKPEADDLAKVLQDVEQVAEWRERLSDISWLMKLVSERIAKSCNALDNITGHFWEGRYKAILLLDEQALLACSMYVDLNRIKAELAASLESSDFTSIQRRLQSFVIRAAMQKMLAEQVNNSEPVSSPMTTVQLDDSQAIPVAVAGELSAALPDAHLAPVQIDEKNDPIGPHLSTSETRCSDKGFLPMTQEKYVELLRWTTDQLQRRKDGQTLNDCPTTLTSQKLDAEVWCKLATEFADLFFVVAGMPESIDKHRSCRTGKRFYMPQKTRELLAV